MDKIVILGGNAQTHPVTSYVVGMLCVAAVVVALALLTLRSKKK